MSTSDAPPRWLGFVSGVVAGGSGVIAGHAFDTLKVQAQAGQKAAPAQHDPGLAASVRAFLKLYRGILPPLLSTGAVRSFYFGVFENVKAAVRNDSAAAEMPLSETFAAGAITGGIVAPVTSPFVVLKLRQQVQGGTMSELVGRIGVRGLWRGLPLHCVLETIGSGVYLTTYSAAKRVVKRASGEGGSSDNVESLPLKVSCGPRRSRRAASSSLSTPGSRAFPPADQPHPV